VLPFLKIKINGRICLFSYIKSLSYVGSCAALLPGAPGELLHESFVFLPYLGIVSFVSRTRQKLQHVLRYLSHTRRPDTWPEKLIFLIKLACYLHIYVANGDGGSAE